MTPNRYPNREQYTFSTVAEAKAFKKGAKCLASKRIGNTVILWLDDETTYEILT